jgi:hypothetical protein
VVVLHAGRIKNGERLRLSMDVLGGYVGDIGDGSHLISFAEPLYFDWMEQVVNFTMTVLNKPSKIFFGFDEMHGFNRDSRSRALGLSNAELLARTMNTLQGFVRAVDPAAQAMFWADMLCPFHNGGRSAYQQSSGGIAGATAGAADLLDRSIIVVPWWYSGYSTAPVVNCSSPNVAKGCTVNCGNTRCAMNNQATYWHDKGIQWLGAGGTKQENLAAWGKLEKGAKGALGVMTTQWSSPPSTAGIPFAGESGWNQAHAQKSLGCAV